ncbi:MAG: acyl-CoA dehydrogenase family protein [Solimonas sp.]
MNFELDEQQGMLRDSVRRYVEREYAFEARRALLARDGGFSRAQWNAYAEMGWFGIGIDEAFGGYGGGLVESAIVAEELGRGIVVEPYTAAIVQAAHLIRLADVDRATERLAPLLAGDALFAVAHGEPAARGRPAWVETTATPSAGGYVLDGLKSRVAGGRAADTYLVSARHGGTADTPSGISLFSVAAGAPGLEVREYRQIDGSLAADLELSAVPVAAADRLGGEGMAFDAIDRAAAAATICCCAEMVGAMDRALWITRDYLRTRKQFGVAIGSFQALQHRMADMYMALEQARAALHRGLAFAGADDAAVRNGAVSVAKAQAGRSAQYVGAQAVQLHGGIGVTDEYSIGHYFKRLTVLEASYGNSAFHLAGIAGALRAAA